MKENVVELLPANMVKPDQYFKVVCTINEKLKRLSKLDTDAPT